MRPGPGPPGGAEPEATATAMEVEVDEEEEEATAAEVDEDEVVAWASLGGVGCCGVGCCGVGCCCGDWATPEPRWPLPPPAPPGPPPVPPRSAMARPGVRGAGVTGIEATTSGRPGFSPSGGGGGGSTCLLSPPAGARERPRSCTQARGLATRGPRARPPLPVAARAAKTLGGRVRGGGGEPGLAPAPPNAKGRGSRSRSRRACGRAPLTAWKRGLQPARARLAPPLKSAARAADGLPGPPLPRLLAAASGPAEIPLFRGAAPAWSGAAAGARPGPLGSAEPKPAFRSWTWPPPCSPRVSSPRPAKGAVETQRPATATGAEVP